MRVGVVTPRQPPTVGGGFSFHETVLRALINVKTSHEFILLNLSGSDPGDWARIGLPLIDVQAFSSQRELLEQGIPATDHAALELALDVVWYLDPMAEVLSVPVFATVLDLAHRQHPFFPEMSWAGWSWESRENTYRRVLPRAARIFTGTYTGKQQIVRCYGVNPANIVVNPFPVSSFAQITDPELDDAVLAKYSLAPGFLFYPAQFWAHKNHVNLLLALQHLETEHYLAPDLVLTGTDKGYLAYVRRIAADLGLQQRVHFLGFVSGADLTALYRSAAALVYPSLVGPDNLPPLEAFSLGCPVLTGRIKGVEEQIGNAAIEPEPEPKPEPEPEAVEGRFRGLSNRFLKRFQRSVPKSSPGLGESGFAGYFDPTQPDEIAAAMARVLCEVNFRATLIKYGHAIAAERTPDAYVQVVLGALDEFEPWRRNWPQEDMQIASEVSRFPTGLSNTTLLQDGISEDGWLDKCSSLLLSAQRDTSRLKVRGEVPHYGGDNFSTVLSISIDGILMAQPRLYAGWFEFDLEPSGRRGLHRIELAFSDLQLLPDPDDRRVGARLDFIGFKDEGDSAPQDREF